MGATGRWGALNTELHLLLYCRAERPRALALVGSLLAECDRYTRLQLSTDSAELERADREHREIVPTVPERPRLGRLCPPDRPYRPRRRRADGVPWRRASPTRSP